MAAKLTYEGIAATALDPHAHAATRLAAMGCAPGNRFAGRLRGLFRGPPSAGSERLDTPLPEAALSTGHDPVRPAEHSAKGCQWHRLEVQRLPAAGHDVRWGLWFRGFCSM